MTEDWRPVWWLILGVTVESVASRYIATVATIAQSEGHPAEPEAMNSMRSWLLVMIASLVALVLLAQASQFYAHLIVAASAALAFAALGVRETVGGAAVAATESQAAASFRHMGATWAWASIAMIATYLIALKWREWWEFFLAFGLLSALSFFIAGTLARDAAAGRRDETMLRVARGFSIFVLIAMAVVVIGLLVDGKMRRFWTVPGQRPGSQDWAASNIFFCGAFAIAAQAACALRALRNGKA